MEITCKDNEHYRYSTYTLKDAGLLFVPKLLGSACWIYIYIYIYICIYIFFFYPGFSVTKQLGYFFLLNRWVESVSDVKQKIMMDVFYISISNGVAVYIIIFFIIFAGS